MTFVDFVETCQMGARENPSIFGTVTTASAKDFLAKLDSLYRYDIHMIPMRTVDNNWIIVTLSFLETYTPIIVSSDNVHKEMKEKVKSLLT